MRHFVLLLSVIAAVAANVIRGPLGEGDRYFLFPGDGDGKMHLVDSQEPIDEELVREARNPANNRYFLYTRSNPTTPEELILEDVNSVRSSSFGSSKLTVFLSHGWNGDGQNTMSRLLTKSFLEDGDVNVVVLDWGRLANGGYTSASNGVPAVGAGLGAFINWLVASGFTSYDRLHLVGFSLGAHLVGSAGRTTGGRIKRITGLDPAGPLWRSNSDKLAPTDAQYVEVMHTNTDRYGYEDPLGDADFYPNGGDSMPGCLIDSCSHSLSYEYFGATIDHNHLLANRCATYREVTRNRCSGDKVPMGNSDINKSESGLFRVNTGRRYPF